MGTTSSVVTTRCMRLGRRSAKATGTAMPRLISVAGAASLKVIHSVPQSVAVLKKCA